MRVLVCGGGTGGHVYPILAVIEALSETGQGSEDLLYVGAAGSVEERLSADHGLPFARVECGKLRGRSPWKAAQGLAKTARGVWQARQVIRSFRPDVVFSTGGYASAPTLLAARWARVPGMIYLPDIEPGLTIKWLSRLVDRVGVSFDEVRRYFPEKKTIVTGYPVRLELRRKGKLEAHRRLDLGAERPVLMAFGGSQGARSINRVVVGALLSLTELAQVIHVTGPADYAWARQAKDGLPEELQGRYRVYDYLHAEMADALAAADLVVARAGASTMGEFPALGVPSILVPYPYSGQHQAANARFMERHGAAIVIEDADLSTTLVSAVERVLKDESLRAQMAQGARALARPDAPYALAREIRRLGAGKVKSVWAS